MNTDNLILRETDNLPLINKDDTLTSADLDGNFIKIYNDFLALSTANDPTLVFDIDRSYAIGEYATYNGKMWVSTIEVTGVTPDIDSLEWLDIFPTILAHEKNKDTYLDYGGANATSVAEIRAFIDAGLTSTTNLTLTTKTPTSFKIESSTGTDVIIPQATVVDAGLLNAEDKVKLNNLTGINSGDQTLVSLNAEDVDNKVTDFTTINDTLYPTTQAVDTYLTAQVPDLVETFLDSNVEVTTNKAIDFTTVNDTKYPTVKAVDDHINSKLAGLWDDRGSYDASTNLFPSTGGSGGSGAIMKGDIWTINIEGTLGGTLMHVGDTVRALMDAPGQTSTNWALLENAIGYVPENVINKVTTFSGNTTSDTKYPSVKAVVDNFDATNIKSILGVTVLSGSNTGDQDLSGLMVKSNNLSDLTNTITARTNLGLGTLATQSGTFSGTSSGTNTGDQIISDATLTTSDITTNNFTTSKHGFVPKGTNVGNFLKDDGTWGAVASAIPQAQVIYVDSVNGVNALTGRGNINTPYLTPEYALSNTTNTGTFTANTATNTTLSAISDVNNALLEIGMYVSGSGIPFGTIIVAKGNQGGNANTVTLSRATTATATGVTVTWVKTYNVILNGSFIVSSSLFKDGMYINAQSAEITWGAFTLFTLSTTILKTPYYILGKGNYFGTATTSYFISGNATQSVNSTIEIEFGNITSNATDNLFNITTGTTNYNIVKANGDFVNAVFGKVGYFDNWISLINFSSYGLLGGLVTSNATSSSTSQVRIINGTHETPSSVNVLTAGFFTRSFASLTGSTTFSGYASHNGRIVGTAHAIAGECDIVSTDWSSGRFVCSGNVTIRLNGGFLACTSGEVKFYGACETHQYTAISGNIYNHGVISLRVDPDGTGTIYNHGKLQTVAVDNPFRCNIVNHGDFYAQNITPTASGLSLTNYGRLYTSTYGIVLNTNLKLVNYGTIESYGNFTNANAMITINNVSAIFDNYGRIINNSTDITDALIQKTTGTLYLRQGSYLKVANSLSPIRCTANTSASRDVYYFGVTDNCNGTTYGLTFAFDGSSFAPNNLVTGSTLYENVNY